MVLMAGAMGKFKWNKAMKSMEIQKQRRRKR